MTGKTPSPGRAATSPQTGQRFARNLDWNLLRTFHEIVHTGGVSGAARRINRGQPAISMALRRLEEHADAILCRRGPGGFELTSDGELLAEMCETMFGAVSQIPHTLADAAIDMHGRVRIQLISNLVDESIDAALGAFHQDNPNVELFISVATWDVIQRSVIRNEVEIGIAPVTLRTSGLRYETLFQEIYRPYVGQSHPLYAKTVIKPADLAGYSFILTGADEPEPQTRFRQRYDLGIHVAGLSEHLEEARRLTVLGVGVCFLPVSFVARDVADGKLLPVLKTGNDPNSDIFVISNPKAPAHRARTLMLEYLRRHHLT
jgi:DNA-binding transcriptional LysR family regulator